MTPTPTEQKIITLVQSGGDDVGSIAGYSALRMKD